MKKQLGSCIFGLLSGLLFALPAHAQEAKQDPLIKINRKNIDATVFADLTQARLRSNTTPDYMIPDFKVLSNSRLNSSRVGGRVDLEKFNLNLDPSKKVSIFTDLDFSIEKRADFYSKRTYQTNYFVSGVQKTNYGPASLTKKGIEDNSGSTFTKLSGGLSAGTLIGSPATRVKLLAQGKLSAETAKNNHSGSDAQSTFEAAGRLGLAFPMNQSLVLLGVAMAANQSDDKLIYPEYDLKVASKSNRKELFFEYISKQARIRANYADVTPYERYRGLPFTGATGEFDRVLGSHHVASVNLDKRLSKYVVLKPSLNWERTQVSLSIMEHPDVKSRVVTNLPSARLGFGVTVR